MLQLQRRLGVPSAGGPSPSPVIETSLGHEVYGYDPDGNRLILGERSDSNWLGTALLRRGKCAADCRAGVDIVDDRNSLAPKFDLEEFGNRIRDRKKARRAAVPRRL